MRNYFLDKITRILARNREFYLKKCPKLNSNTYHHKLKFTSTSKQKNHSNLNNFKSLCGSNIFEFLKFELYKSFAEIADIFDSVPQIFLVVLLSKYELVDRKSVV